MTSAMILDNGAEGALMLLTMKGLKKAGVQTPAKGVQFPTPFLIKLILE